MAYQEWSDKYPLAPVKLQSANAAKPLRWIVKTKDSRNITLEAVCVFVSVSYRRIASGFILVLFSTGVERFMISFKAFLLWTLLWENIDPR